MSKYNYRKLRIAMLAYSFYESDNRVRRYAETLSREGHYVDVISLRRKRQKKYNELNGVKIYRVQERVRNERGKINYLIRIIKFFLNSTVRISLLHIKKPYDIIHVHSVPDFEVFATLIPKLSGAKIILDIHDIVPEFYAAKFNVSKKAFVYKMLIIAEKLSIAFSDHVIISNDLWKKKVCTRSVNINKCTTIINYPDERLFYKKEKKNRNNNFIFLYPGTLNHHQGLDLAIKAFYIVKRTVREAELHIVGDGPAKKELMNIIKELGLENHVFIKDPVPLEAIAEIMATADVGIIPKRNDEFGGEAFSTKSLEFMSLGIPIIISRTKIDQYYFEDSFVRFFMPDQIDDLAQAMLDLASNSYLRRDLSLRGMEFAQKNRWGKKKYLYMDILDCLNR